MSARKPCPFCGHIHSTMESGPCTHTRPDLFMAQVHCGHCGATGTRYCGEETLQLAEVRARQSWNAGTPDAPHRATGILDSSTYGMTLSIIALAVSYGLYDGVHSSALFGFLVGSILLHITMRLFLRGRKNQALKNQINEQKAAEAHSA